MFKFIVFVVISIAVTKSIASPDVFEIVLKCSPNIPSNYFTNENLSLVLNRSQLPRITAHYIKEADRSADYILPVFDSGDLVGTEYFEIIKLDGIVTREQDNSKIIQHRIKLIIQNGRLHFMDPIGRFVETKPYDQREWSCLESK